MIGLALLLATVAAQEPPLPGPEPAVASRKQTVQVDYLAVRGGGSLPVFGVAFTDLDGTEVDYHDMVDPGTAVSLEMGAIYRTPHHFALGGYLEVGLANHPGDEAVSTLGRYAFEDFDTVRATGGLRFIAGSGSGFSLEAFAAGGLVRFDDVAADFTPTGLTASVPVEVFNRTLRGLGLGGVRLGVGGDGFSVQVSISAWASFGPEFDGGFLESGRGGTFVASQADLGIQIGF